MATDVERMIAEMDGQPWTSLSDTRAARQLATMTKTQPQMAAITSRWLLKLLPWVQVSAGTYRVNRRLTYELGDGLISFVSTGSEVKVVPQELTEIPMLRGYGDEPMLGQIAGRFEKREYKPGDVIVERGRPLDWIVLMVHGKANLISGGRYGEETVVHVVDDGKFFGDERLEEQRDTWPYTAKAVTPCTVMILPQKVLEDLISQNEGLRRQIERYQETLTKPRNRQGEAEIALAAGHVGEPDLPGTFVEYDLTPREYELSVAQTVLRVHSRVADLYNKPMNQLEQQLRLTIEALRERQDSEMVNNPSFGLLYNADFKYRIPTRTGPPTPDDLDDMLSRQRKSQFFLAHPRAIAAFGRECNRRGLYPTSVDVAGHKVPAWRDVPIFPCSKIPISETNTSTIFVLRTGEAEQGVVGLHQTGIPDEYEPSLNVRFMGIDEKGVISYLVSAYYSMAVLVPDALVMLENVDVGR